MPEVRGRAGDPPQQALAPLAHLGWDTVKAIIKADLRVRYTHIPRSAKMPSFCPENGVAKILPEVATPPFRAHKTRKSGHTPHSGCFAG